MSRHTHQQTGPSLWDTSTLTSCDTENTSSSPMTPLADYRSCVLKGHQWHVVSRDGRLQCEVCRVIAHCPHCTPTFPPTALLAFCMAHQEVTQ